MSNKRVLVSTIAARSGGVPVMISFAVETLRSLGFEPVIAYYEPYSLSPKLSVPTFALGRRRPSATRAEPMFDCETHAMGAWLPEFEFTTYGLTPQWRALIDSCAHHVAVSGNVLAARPLVLAGKKPLAWIATDWHGDRAERVRSYGVGRRLLDAIVVDPLTSRLERELLRSVVPLALSEHTARQIARLSGQANVSVCPTPIDTERFVPNEGLVQPGTVLFSGRLDDPRKNVGLLVDAVAKLHQKGQAVNAVLVGGSPTQLATHNIRSRGLEQCFEIVPYLRKDELAARLQMADVFVLPSHQEGLCIAALEAMASGAPVVTTRCGGPEEFVLPGKTGLVVDFSVDQLADAIATIVFDRALRARMASSARELVVTRYAYPQARALLLRALGSAIPEPR